MVRSLWVSFSLLILVGRNPLQPALGVIMDMSRCNSACSGTRDWMKIVAWDGSTPAATSQRSSPRRWPRFLGVVVICGQGMPIGSEEQAGILRLQRPSFSSTP